MRSVFVIYPLYLLGTGTRLDRRLLDNPLESENIQLCHSLGEGMVSRRKHTGARLFVFISLLALVATLIGTSTGSATDKVKPLQATPQVTEQSDYVPPVPGDPVPVPEMPGMSAAAETTSRRELSEYDAVVAAAMIEADNAFRSQTSAPGATVAPIAPKLPKVDRPDGPIFPMLQLPDLQLTADPAGSSGSWALTPN